MTKKNTILHLNGKTYDAVTGKQVSGVLTPIKQSARSIDGVMRNTASPQTSQTAPEHQTNHTVPTTLNRKPHSPAPVAKARKPHASKTLMRHAVQKPEPSHRTRFHVLNPADVTLAPVALPEYKLSVSNIDKRRAARAQHVAKSKLITRFSSEGMATASIGLGAPSLTQPATSVPLLAPVIFPKTASRPTAHKPARGHQKSMDIFQKALMQATSHEQRPATSKIRPHRAARKHTNRRRLTSVSTAVLAMVLIGGFLAYQNVTNMTLRMASHKAGFAATLPGYRPSGFSIGKFAYSPGNVVINFSSNSDTSRRFAITEQPSSWDSETLLNNYVAANNQNYQTVQAAGRTVYIAGQKATWVNNGIWYQVDTGNALSSSQLIDLASSM